MKRNGTMATSAGVSAGVHSDRAILVHHVAKIVELSPRHVRYLAKHGGIPAFKMGEKIWGFHRADVDAYLAKREALDADR